MQNVVSLREYLSKCQIWRSYEELNYYDTKIFNVVDRELNCDLLKVNSALLLSFRTFAPNFISKLDSSF